MLYSVRSERLLMEEMDSLLSKLAFERRR
jgi:hypothetical protein